MAKGRSLDVARRLKPALSALLLFGAACAWPSPERQLLLDFFQACRVYDTTVLARLATASCNPQTDGVVQNFDVVGVDAVASGARVVSIDARVRPLGGSAAPRRLTIRLEQVQGRWMVANITAAAP